MHLETLHAPHGTSSKASAWISGIMAVRFITSERRRIWQTGTFRSGNVGYGKTIVLPARLPQHLIDAGLAYKGIDGILRWLKGAR